MDEPGGFREFVESRSAALLRAAWVLTGNWHDAQDLVQTALAAAWPKWDTVASPDAYVHRVMVTTYLRGQRRRWAGELATDPFPDQSRVDDTLDQAALRASLIDAVRALPPRQRAVVALRYLADLSETQTAAALGCSPGTVRAQASRALARLRAVPELAETIAGGPS